VDAGAIDVTGVGLDTTGVDTGCADVVGVAGVAVDRLDCDDADGDGVDVVAGCLARTVLSPCWARLRSCDGEQPPSVSARKIRRIV